MQLTREQLGEQIVALLPRLRRFARALASNVHDADDLVQIAVENALSHAHQLRADAPLASWLFGILRNAWIDECRARRRRERVHVSEELGANVPDGSVRQRDELWSIQKAMEHLPEEQREVVALVLVEGLAYREAAELMNVPIGTVTSRLARARAALQDTLKERPSSGAIA